jgi:hypothetical protein
MPEKNVSLARKIVEQIRNEPELTDMNNWTDVNSCGTTYCFAGWAAHLSNLKVYEGGWLDAERQLEHVEEWAKYELGLTSEEAGRLFFSRDDNVIQVASEIFGEEL